MRHVRCLLLAFLLASPAAAPAEDAPENLVLRAKGGRVVSVSSEYGAAWPADALIDGQVTDHGYSTAERSRLPQDIVLAFYRDQIATVRRIVLNPASKGSEDCRVQDFEVLVSLASPIDGFVSLGRWALTDAPEPQAFDLPAARAKFVKVRLLSNRGGRSATLNEIEVWGVLPKEPQFFVSEQDPARLDRFRKLRADSLVPAARTPLEDRLLADAADGKLDQLGLASAAFIASGATDDKRLARYVSQFKSLVDQAKAAVHAAGKTDAEKGRLVFAWLHQGFFARYRSNWTDLTDVFDTREFNCVSSATLYNAVGEQFGLDLRAIEVPDHVFSLLAAGAELLDVETTTPAGFNPVRDPAALQEFQKRTGFVYIEDRHSRQRREVGDVGLVAIVYYNRGVGFSDAGKHAEAAACYMKALDLDPGNSSALRNLVAEYNNWGVDAMKAGDFPQAIRIFREGLRIDAFNPPLDGNRTVAFQNWGVARIKAKDWPGAVEACTKALEETPGNPYFKEMGREVYEAWAADLGSGGDLAAMDRILAEGAERLGLPDLATTGKAEAIERLALADLKLKDYARAVAFLDAARKLAPDDPRIRTNWQAAWYEWAQSFWDAGNPRDAIAKYTEGLKADPTVHLFRQNRAYILQEWMRKLAEAGQDDELERALAEALALDPEDRDYQEARVVTFQNYGFALAQKGKYARAIEVYERGLAGAARAAVALRQNRAAAFHAWAEELAGAGRAADAECLVVQAAEADPQDDRLATVRNGFFLRRSKELIEKKEFAAAAALLGRGARIAATGDVTHQRAFAYQEWAADLTGRGQPDEAERVLTEAVRAEPKDAQLRQVWKAYVVNQGLSRHQAGDSAGAVALYGRGLAVEPGEGTFRRNRKAIWLEWAGGLAEKGDRARGAEVLERAVKEEPEDRELRQALEEVKK